MTIGLCFWILMLVWLVFGLWTVGWFSNGRAVGIHVLLFILLLLLGWAQFGAPLHR